MASETQLIEFPFASGQSQATDRAVLPVGRFYTAQNCRYRKGARLGKRHGYTVKTATDASVAALGNGNGRVNCVGPKFCAVDDRFYFRDEQADTWTPPSLPSTASGDARLQARWPQFLPTPAFNPLANQSPLDLYVFSGGAGGTLLPSVGGFTYTQGVLWFMWCWWRNSDVQRQWVATVVAVDPTSRQQVFRQDLPLDGDNTDAQRPVLLSTTNGTVVLVADTFTAGAKDGLAIYLLTSRATGFNFTPTAVACVESACNYYIGSADEILIVRVLSGALTDVVLGVWNVTSQTFTTTNTRNTAGNGNASQLSCYGIEGDSSWVSYFGSTFSQLSVNAYSSALVSTMSNNDAWNAAFTPDAVGPMLFCRIPGTSPTQVFGLAVMTAGGTAVTSFSGTSASSSFYQASQVQAISYPFDCDGQVFCWMRHAADQQLGVATLCRIPLESEFSGVFSSASFPPQATVDNRDIDSPVTLAQSGPTVVTPLSTPLGYMTMLTPTQDSVVTTGPTTYLNRTPLAVAVRHRSEGIRYAPAHVTDCQGKSFVAAAQPLWVDAHGVYEAGFIQAPTQPVEVAKLAGGNLTASSTYAYTAHFESVDSLGHAERSAPATPVSIALGVGETRTRVQFSGLELSQKEGVKLKIYRTLASQSIYRHLITVDATPCVTALPDGSSYVVIEDDAADSIVEQNGVLFTQVGQEFEPSQTPACSFANVGGGRLWVGGGFAGNVVQASKLFTPGLSPEFCDDDAWRVTLPADCTGSAWCDQQVLFTREAIFYVAGDGPDNTGNGFFTRVELPFRVGCIDHRSVVSTSRGVYFQSARGMMLLPRGFGEPIPVDEIQDTIESYPIVTSARAFPGDDEDTVQWCMSSDESSTTGAVAVYDMAYNAWYVDTFTAPPAVFSASWSGERLLTPALTTQTHPFRLDDTAYSDGGNSIALSVETGDVRPWGTFSHGVVNKVGVLGTLRSACTVNVTKTTDRGTQSTSRVYTGIAPDYVAGDQVWLEVALGNTEQRDVNFLRFSFAETSAVEGMAFINIVLEHQTANQGFRLQQEADRVT